MNDAWHRCGNKPGKTDHTVDKVEQSTQTEVIVVRLAVFEVVALVVDQVPRDSGFQ